MSVIKQKLTQTFRFIVMTVALTAFVACDDPGAPDRTEFVDVAPEPAAVQPGDTVRLDATPRTRTGKVLTGRAITWTSEDNSIATVSANGLVTGRATGSVLIFAKVDGKVGSSRVSVWEPIPEPVISVQVSPELTTAAPSEVVQFAATPLDINGMPLQRDITWRSSDNSVALVDPSGLVLAVAPGTVDIIATSEGRQGHGTLIVQAPRLPVARVEPVLGGVVSLYTQETRQLSVRAFAANGTELFDRPVTWTNGDEAIARVNATGMVEARGVGSTDVIARVEGVSAPMAIDVRSRIVRIYMSSSSLAMAPGEDATLRATPVDDHNGPLQRTITWVSSNESVATVDANGRVQARAAGTAIIRAIAEGHEGWTDVRVVPWVQRPLQLIGDSVPPATLFSSTSTDANGVTRTTRVVAQNGSFSMALTGSNSGRYEQLFAVSILVDGQMTQFAQYVYRGDFQYDYLSHQFVLSSYSGQTLSAKLQPDGKMIVTGRLESNKPVVTLTYGPQQ